MNCKEALHLIQRQVDNDLSLEEEERLETHLAQCTACQVQVDELCQLSLHLASLPKVKPSKSIVDSILPELDQQDVAQQSVGKSINASRNKLVRKRFWMPGLALVAGLFILLIVLNEDQHSPLQQNSLTASEAELTLEESTPEFVATQEDATTFVTENGVGSMSRRSPGAESVSQSFSLNLPEENESSIVKEGVANGEEAEKLRSPDGVYIAYLGIDQEEIFIDKEDEAYYMSKHSWKAPWVVKHLAWVGQDQLYYVLYHPELEEYQYWLINVEERKEEQLDEAYWGVP